MCQLLLRKSNSPVPAHTEDEQSSREFDLLTRVFTESAGVDGQLLNTALPDSPRGTKKTRTADKAQGDEVTSPGKPLVSSLPAVTHGPSQEVVPLSTPPFFYEFLFYNRLFQVARISFCLNINSDNMSFIPGQPVTAVVVSLRAWAVSIVHLLLRR